MKTCEEYVLKELEKAKEQVSFLIEVRDEFLIMGKAFLGFINVLKKYMYVTEDARGNKFIAMKYIFEEFEKEDFNTIEDMLIALEKEETEEDDD